VTKVLTQSSQAIIYIGQMKNFDSIIERDKPYVLNNKPVVLKQF
jgi:hypothetical protein